MLGFESYYEPPVAIALTFVVSIFWIDIVLRANLVAFNIDGSSVEIPNVPINS